MLVAHDTCCMCSRGRGVTVDDGDCHGEVDFGQNFYRGSRRLVYRAWVLLRNYSLSKLWNKEKIVTTMCLDTINNVPISEISTCSFIWTI